MKETRQNSQKTIIESETSEYYLGLFRDNHGDCRLYNGFVSELEGALKGLWLKYTKEQLYQLHVVHSDPEICDKLQHPYQPTS